MNLQEDHCSFELSKFLKEKGFDIPCKYAWHGGIKKPDFHRHSINFNGGDYKDLRTKWYSAPTHQMAMKWLREKGYHIVVFTDSPKYEVKIQDLNDGSFNVSGITHTYDTYEEAVEAALKYSLENLI